MNNLIVDVEEKWAEKINELDIDDFDDEEELKEEQDNLKEYSYSEILTELDEDELSEIISNNDTSEFFKFMFNGSYTSGLDYLEMIYGEFKTTKHDPYSTRDDADKTKFDAIEKYINWSKVDEDLLYDTEQETKEEFYKDNIVNDKDLQEEIFKYDKKNAIYLFDILDDNSDLGFEEDFQRLFIEQSLEQEQEDAENDEVKQEIKKDELPNILLKVDDKFELIDILKNEYREYTHLISLKNFDI